jgi:hypothetical protein
MPPDIPFFDLMSITILANGLKIHRELYEAQQLL